MMVRQSVMVFIGIILIGGLCWAAGPFQNILRTVKGHSDVLKSETWEMAHQINRIRELTIEIDELSYKIEYKDQIKKIERLDAKIERLNKWVNDLGYKTDMLKKLVTKMSHESKMLVKNRGKKCGPGKVWIPRQKSPSGQWVPGHCAPSY